MPIHALGTGQLSKKPSKPPHIFLLIFFLNLPYQFRFCERIVPLATTCGLEVTQLTSAVAELALHYKGSHVYSSREQNLAPIEFAGAFVLCCFPCDITEHRSFTRIYCDHPSRASSPTYYKQLPSAWAQVPSKSLRSALPLSSESSKRLTVFAVLWVTLQLPTHNLFAVLSWLGKFSSSFGFQGEMGGDSACVGGHEQDFVIIQSHKYHRNSLNSRHFYTPRSKSVGDVESFINMFPLASDKYRLELEKLIIKRVHTCQMDRSKFALGVALQLHTSQGQQRPSCPQRRTA